MDSVDLLQIKIEKAKRELPLETVNAIDSVNWKAVILTMRETKGYTFEQLGDLELETELLLAGLLDPKDYPKEIQKRMGISDQAANEIVKEMNEKVFNKIKEAMIKNTERKETFQKNQEKVPEPEIVPPKVEEKDNAVLNSAGIEIMPAQGEKAPIVAPKPEIHPLMAQKLSGSVQVPVTKTEHTLENITKVAPVQHEPVSRPAVDPYREIPE